MILYHGTSISRGHQILAEGMIKRTSIENRMYNFLVPICVNGEYIDASTTLGYVYLTDLILMAADYGVKAAQQHDDEVCIFRMELDPRLLLPDYDQMKDTRSRYRRSLPLNCTALDSLEHLGCAAFPHDIDLMQAAVSYTFIPTHLKRANGETSEQEDELLENINTFGTLNSKDLAALRDNRCFYEDALDYFANIARWHTCNPMTDT